MGSGCGDPIVASSLRPPGKLPVPVALNAGSPTLFAVYYTRFFPKCKEPFRKIPDRQRDLSFCIITDSKIRQKADRETSAVR